MTLETLKYSVLKQQMLYALYTAGCALSAFFMSSWEQFTAVIACWIGSITISTLPQKRRHDHLQNAAIAIGLIAFISLLSPYLPQLPRVAYFTMVIVATWLLSAFRFPLFLVRLSEDDLTSLAVNLRQITAKSRPALQSHFSLEYSHRRRSFYAKMTDPLEMITNTELTDYYRYVLDVRKPWIRIETKGADFQYQAPIVSSAHERLEILANKDIPCLSGFA